MGDKKNAERPRLEVPVTYYDDAGLPLPTEFTQVGPASSTARSMMNDRVTTILSADDEFRLPSTVIDTFAEGAFDSEAMRSFNERMGLNLESILAAAYLDPELHSAVDAAMDEFWGNSSIQSALMNSGSTPDVVIGAGLHAAIYCAVTHRKTGRKPLVLTGDSRVGGAFAVSRDPAFYLNSRNRPGPLGLPGQYDRPSSLNTILGAPLQPSMLSSDEYADNSTLGYVIRMMLMAHATVVTNAPVMELTNGGVFVNGQLVFGDKVIVATGMGEAKRFPVQKTSDGTIVQSYDQFMTSMDGSFPLMDLKRVAVIGGGDSGKTVIEALTGQGPARSHWSVAAMDWVENIDWYGPNQQTCSQWEENNRSRYKSIGRNLPREMRSDLSNGDPIYARMGRVNILGKRATNVSVGMGEAMVDGVPYDRVIVATGYEMNRLVSDEVFTNDSIERYGGMIVGRKFNNGGVPVYLAGPVARLELTREEEMALQETSGVTIPENLVSIFRYSRKTAALATAIN